jgi:hypothetical protein
MPSATHEILYVHSTKHLQGVVLNQLSTATTFYLSMALQPFIASWSLFSFLILYTVGRTPWTADQPVARLLPTQTENKRTQTSIPRVGFEPMTPTFERAKTVHALEGGATVIGSETTLPVANLTVIDFSQLGCPSADELAFPPFSCIITSRTASVH